MARATYNDVLCVGMRPKMRSVAMWRKTIEKNRNFYAWN